MSGTEPFAWQVGDVRALTHTFAVEEIRAFAQLTGDTNPLHVDATVANRSVAGGQVVHGMLAASFVSTLIGVHLPGQGALWQSFEVNWRKMVRIGDTLRFEARVTAVQAATRTLDLQISGVNAASGEVHLEGKARVMMTGEPPSERATSLNGKRVLVTGASGEVGAQISRTLVDSGCQIVAWGRDAAKLDALERELGAGVASVQIVDLLDESQIDAALDRLESQAAIDGLVHAAAAPLQLADVQDRATRQYLRDHWQVEVLALHQVSQRLITRMPAGGFVIALLTQAVIDAPPTRMSAYVAAKMGALGLIRSLAVELGPRGLRCNAVSPGLMQTPYVRDMSVRAKQIEAATNPLRRLCTVEDVARAVTFLAGPESAYLNGVNLPVTGGARMP